jgi:hypothetical protein
VCGGTVDEAQGAAVRAADANPVDLVREQQFHRVMSDQAESGCRFLGSVLPVPRRPAPQVVIVGGRGTTIAASLIRDRSPTSGSPPPAAAMTARSIASRSRRAKPSMTSGWAGVRIGSPVTPAVCNQRSTSSGSRSVSRGSFQRSRRVLT